MSIKFAQFFPGVISAGSVQGRCKSRASVTVALKEGFYFSNDLYQYQNTVHNLSRSDISK